MKIDLIDLNRTTPKLRLATGNLFHCRTSPRKTIFPRIAILTDIGRCLIITITKSIRLKSGNTLASILLFINLIYLKRRHNANFGVKVFLRNFMRIIIFAILLNRGRKEVVNFPNFQSQTRKQSFTISRLLWMCPLNLLMANIISKIVIGADFPRWKIYT